MKTSIKILLGLLLVIFMIPTVIIMAYSYKVKNGDFKKYNEAEHWSRVDLGPSRFIKVIAPEEEVLECTLKLSDKPHYMVWEHGQGGGDSVSISQQADTLFVTYLESKENDNARYHRDVELFVNEWQQLQVVGATVKIDSSFGTSDKTITLAGAKLELGVGREDYDANDEGGDMEIQSGDSSSRRFNNLKLNATNSKLVVNSGFNINYLQLAFNGGSINIRNGATMQDISGFVSPATKLRVTGAFVSNFKPVATK